MCTIVRAFMGLFLCVCVCVSEETQRRVSALEEMQRRLEEEHALQMSLLMAEQEREQQRLCQVRTWNHGMLTLLNVSKATFVTILPQLSAFLPSL